MKPITVLALFFLLAPAARAAEAPASYGFSTASLDRSVQPCDDFYQFACGGWLAKNPIPADQSRWGRFNEVAERNRVILRGILEKAAVPSPDRSEDDRKLGDFYASCMDEKASDARGADPLKKDLADIAAMKDAKDVSAEITRLFAAGVSSFFGFDSTQDYKDATSVIAEADQGGLGLPNRDYYLMTDTASIELRGKYTGHVRKMFELAGYDASASSAAADTVMRFETKLAGFSMDKVERRDPEKTYHKLSAAEFSRLVPAIDWPAFYVAAGTPEIRYINAASPDYLKKTGELIASAPLGDWKAYLAWKVINDRAGLLSQAFINEDFEFYEKTLKGARELRPRWKRCVDHTDGAMGELLGKRFVELAFNGKAKTSALEMVQNIEKAFHRDIDGLDWMSPATKAKAGEKLTGIENKIGYPDKWRDYSALEVKRDGWFENSNRAGLFEMHRRLNKIGKPLDRSEWEMSPPTVNAYYHPMLNTINFPAGILQPPFFDAELDPAVNYGGIGGVIAHELTHGFDDQGRKFDSKGNMTDWWTPADAKGFVARSECLVKEYSGFQVPGGLPVNGKLTLGENTADNGGLRIALMALNDPATPKPEGLIDGFTQEQRVFLGWAQVWCTNSTDAALRRQALTDPHSPPRNRVNGVMENMPEFAKAFSCGKGQAMVSTDPCRVW